MGSVVKVTVKVLKETAAFSLYFVLFAIFLSFSDPGQHILMCAMSKELNLDCVVQGEVKMGLHPVRPL